MFQRTVFKAAGSLVGALGSPGATESRQKFFSEWIKACGSPKVLIHDTTSISTYSNLLEDAEWGYNRDNEQLPHRRETLRKIHSTRSDHAKIGAGKCTATKHALREFL